jgi:Tol biopolymer transport system component
MGREAIAPTPDKSRSLASNLAQPSLDRLGAGCIYPFIILVFLVAALSLTTVLGAEAQTPERLSGEIAFFAHRGSPPGIALLDLASGRITILGVTSPADMQHGAGPAPVWSPDGGKVAYVCYQGNFADICMADIASGKLLRLTSHEERASQGTSGVDIYNLSWSPDGSRIAFDRQVSPARPPRNEILVVDLEGRSKNLTANAPYSYDSQPSWAADGQLIVFCLYNDKTRRHDIFVMNADGSQRRGVVSPEPEGDYSSPLWSPAGQLAFLSTSLYVLPHLNGTPLNLGVVVPSKDEVSTYTRERLAWSPDGQRLALVAGALGQRELRALSADGTGVLIASGEPSYYSYPTWSADSRWIAYERSSTIWVVSAHGGEPYRLAEGRAPAWRPVLPSTPTPTPLPTPSPTAATTPAMASPATRGLDDIMDLLASISLVAGLIALAAALLVVAIVAFIYRERRR